MKTPDSCVTKSTLDGHHGSEEVGETCRHILGPNPLNHPGR